VINLKELGDILKNGVIEKIDHKNINLDVDFMSGKMSSTENLVIGIWEQIEKDILNLGGELAKIKLVETENNFVEYFGGKEPF
ncbi:6-carboxytetrahydropterin synthase, partial [Crocinitomicaceae bacterium]|nr:6-carboxytetrahydropterin synthase [Crocinitomicaceae bacterium]